MGMMNEEAIKRLKEARNTMQPFQYVNEAIDYAIKVLEQQPNEDCINRHAVNELVDELARAISDERCCISRGRSTATIMQDILDLPSVTPQQTRWIPVSERFPEENGRYLVTRGLNACGALWNRVYIINYSDLMGLKSERIWWDGNVGKSDFKRIDDVIAWMPLPTIYQGEENG